jgi:hypothetical protein
MQHYLEDLNQIAESVISTKGQHLDSLYAKIVEGKELGYEFVKVEPSINHIDQDNVSISNKMLFEHYSYLIKVKNEAYGNNFQFFMNIEEDIKRTIRLIYQEERQDEYFGKVENRHAIYYIFTDSVIDFVIDKALNRHLEFLYYHHKINAKNFIQVWLDFFRKSTLSINYDSNKNYTKELLYYVNSDINDVKNSKLLDYLKKNLGPTLNIYREDKFSDVSFYSSHKFQRVMSLHNDKENRHDVFNKSKYEWWSQCMISLEHENNYLMAYEEMMYLTTRRARLKVLVTYYDDDTPEETQNIFITLCENFSLIIRQSNILFNENEQTEYLLIVGSRLKDQQTVIWSIQAFNWSGQWTEKFSEL